MAMKTYEAHTSLKQGLYKLYLLKSLKEGVELKDIKEKINNHIQDDSIGAGYRNLVRDYVKAGLVRVEDKTYSLTDQGEGQFEQLSQNLLEYAKDFNDVPPPTLEINDEVIAKFDFKDYPLEISSYFSLKPQLNKKLTQQFDLTTKEFQKEILEALVFSNDSKLKRIKENFQRLYQERIEKLLSPNALAPYQASSLLNSIKTSFIAFWVLRAAGILLLGNILGYPVAIQAMKIVILAHLGIKVMQNLSLSFPRLFRLLAITQGLFPLLLISGIYFINTKLNSGISLKHIRTLDIVLITLATGLLFNFFAGHIQLKGAYTLKKSFQRLHKYKRPLSIFLSGVLLLFFHITYDILTAQLANITALLSIIPMILGVDLFEQFENIQGATTDIKNQGFSAAQLKNLH